MNTKIYSTPTVEIIEVTVEAGIAQSIGGNKGGEFGNPDPF